MSESNKKSESLLDKLNILWKIFKMVKMFFNNNHLNKWRAYYLSFFIGGVIALIIQGFIRFEDEFEWEIIRPMTQSLDESDHQKPVLKSVE